MPLPEDKDSTAKPFKSSNIDEVRRVWTVQMPGMTGDLLVEAAKACSVIPSFQMVNFSPEQWQDMKAYCERKLGLSDDWEDEAYGRMVMEAKEKGWMKNYGPTPIINKKKLKQDRDVGKKNTVPESTDQQNMF